MAKFRKKPVVIDAMQYDGSVVSAHAICKWVGLGLARFGPAKRNLDSPKWDGSLLEIKTLESRDGYHEVSPRDWVIRGVKGEFYPCKPDIFEATYEPEEQPPCRP